MQDSKFGINTKSTSHDRLDGEVIVVDLESGSYYCLTDSGADIWTLVVQGLSIEEIDKTLNENYIGEQLVIRMDTEKFINKLIEIKIIFPIKSAEKHEFQLPNDLIRSKWIEPNIDEYNDMWDLIKMDPIHESNEELGWPEKKENN